jgi:hypothetical protein
VRILTPEAEHAPMSHIKVKKWEKENVLTKIIENKAFSVETAINQEELELEKNEILALERLVEEGLLIETTKEKGQYYHLKEDLKPKNYRKAVVMGFSIPLLIFVIALILAGIGAIIYQIVVGI